MYEFGPYALDVHERRLWNAGHVVALRPKAHDVLVALVRRAGTLVTKRELLDLVWRDVSVEEGILAVYVSSLRKSLGDCGETGAYIETVPRAGYRFSGAVRLRTVPAEPLSMRWPIGVLPARPEVSELIGRGRACLMTASRSDIPRAVEAFRSAIALDPDYAAAHAGLAVAHCAEAELRLAAPQVAYPSARAAALRALAMEASNADAQVALGTVLFLSDWNWNGARRSLERALELNADHTEGWLLYGRLLEALGYLAEGLAAKQRALERDPSSATVHLQIALSYWNQRRYDDMIAWATRSLDLDPQHLLAREYLASAYWKKGDLDRHMAESLTHARAAGAPLDLLEDLRRTYDTRGRAGIVEFALRANANGPPMQLALLHGEAGNLDEAFAHLDAAIASRDPALVHVAVAPQWDCLRGDARFHERLEDVGLDAAADRCQRYLQQHGHGP
ncbi:Transcriptional activator CadC [Luteitalea pratensis]|uniref:Transcriptional activator CadC n=1 Tax=Luteitalea pratensis TaxID=1855912 RepID=A0A143PL10_LUTPR|nr:Transcriptional activator CadC [Luteitalea pratensis]